MSKEYIKLQHFAGEGVGYCREPDININCPFDDTVMPLLKDIPVVDMNDRYMMPVFKCPKCLKRFTSIKRYEDLKCIYLEGLFYINVLPKNGDIKESNGDNNLHEQSIITPKRRIGRSEKRECYIYSIEKPTICWDSSCKHQLNEEIVELETTYGVLTVETKVCPSCGKLYVPYSWYTRHGDTLVFLNKNAMDYFMGEGKTFIENQSYSEEKIRPAIEKPQKIERTIQVRDFVVRQTAFKCRKEAHPVHNIDAVIGILNREGTIVYKTISAGYCSVCNIYFIMESVYQNLKRYGTLICRISDEKSYLKNHTFMNGMQLAQQSILMQYGYNVSQEEGLTSQMRHAILATLVDSDVLSRNEIIGYLDFFINQRKGQNKYDNAILKWKEDREYISGYKIGDYESYGVRSLRRR